MNRAFDEANPGIKLGYIFLAQGRLDLRPLLSRVLPRTKGINHQKTRETSYFDEFF